VLLSAKAWMPVRDALISDIRLKAESDPKRHSTRSTHQDCNESVSINDLTVEHRAIPG